MSAWMNKDNDPRIKGIASAIRVVPNFPKPGIMFKDITTLLLDPKAFKNTVDLFVEHYTGKNISVVAGTLPPFPFLTGENVTVPFWTSRILSDRESRPGAMVRLH